MDHYNMGHRATDFTRWMGAKVAYRIAYEEVRLLGPLRVLGPCAGPL